MVHELVAAVFDTDGMTEDELSALREVCLITLDQKNADERLSDLYDRYGEGDDYLLNTLMALARALESVTQQEVMGEYCRLSTIRAFTRNK